MKNRSEFVSVADIRYLTGQSDQIFELQAETDLGDFVPIKCSKVSFSTLPPFIRGYFILALK